MNLIDRYVYVVTERLPQDTREDVDRELRANIEDMLPENATEEDIREVLEKLGNPTKLASEYSQSKRYLIGPDMYDNYISVLKLVLGIVITVFVSITILSWFFKSSVDMPIFEVLLQIFIDVLASVIQGITQAVLWVTLIFVILERAGINEGKLPYLKKKWSPDDLLDVQIPGKRNISRGETVFSMCCTVLFTSLLYFQPELIGWYAKGKTGLALVAPLISVERLQAYIPVILILTLFSLSILVWKFLSRHWNKPLAIVNAIYNVAICVLLSIMISDNSLLNQKFASNFADLVKLSPSKMNAELSKFTWVFVTVFILICIWDSISSFIKCKK